MRLYILDTDHLSLQQRGFQPLWKQLEVRAAQQP